MIIAGGIVTPQPLGITSSNPSFEKQAQERKANQEKQINDIVDKLAKQHQENQKEISVQKPVNKWSVPFR